jgi:hypothetical protein
VAICALWATSSKIIPSHPITETFADGRPDARFDRNLDEWLDDISALWPYLDRNSQHRTPRGRRFAAKHSPSARTPYAHPKPNRLDFPAKPPFTPR